MRPVETFLSHADEDKIIARKLADALEIYGFRVFVAHDDIGIGEEWEKTLKDKIQQSELFLVLLSKNFHNAHFTDHEVGIASAYNKKIFPVRVDDTKPYGFMSRFQAQKISPEIIKDEVGSMTNRLITLTDEGKRLLEDKINDFCTANSFDDASTRSKHLFELFNFTPKQINKIADAYIRNDQIRRSWRANPRCLSFLEKNWSNLNEKNQSGLEEFITPSDR